MRKVSSIETGVHGNRVGFTMHFEEGGSETHLFSEDVAVQLSAKLLEAITLLRNSRGVASEEVRASDSVNIGLTSKGDTDEKKVH
jgi:hypothetical protein